MASAKNGNVEKKNEEVDNLGVPTNFNDWEEEQTGFAPYWNPDKGKSIVCRVMDKDTQAQDFVRYMLQAGEDIECKRGPAESAEDVTVKKGEFFTMSVYYSTEGLFDLYLESGIRPWMKIEVTGESKTKTPGRTVWNWKVLVPRDSKRLLEAYRAEHRQIAAGKQPEQLAEG